jgi:riboflavin kinase/FMN adenylyltransferase
MHISRSIPDIPLEARGGVVCIGNFDGVHIGHAAMLSKARQTAQSRGLPMLVVTFDPHPMVVLRPDVPRPCITTTEQRLKLIARFGPQAVCVVTPDNEFLNTSREAFEEDILHRFLRARCLVEGRSFTYGRGAAGNTQSLRESGVRLGWDVIEIATAQAVLSDQTLVDVSSSLVRWLIAQGRMRDVAVMLGRPYTLEGKVIRGHGRGGSQLGYPTINLALTQQIPADGVYAGLATIDNRVYPAAISVGVNPTFGDGHRIVEAFLMDGSGEYYDQHVELSITHWLRDQERFPSVDLLVRQIGRDVARIRALNAAPDRALATA